MYDYLTFRMYRSVILRYRTDGDSLFANELEVDILGKRRPLRWLKEPLFAPAGKRKETSPEVVIEISDRHFVKP